ncbi:MAG: hypothetical protein RDU14_02510 [Melioribacteraceae bacterium]|nr:hypothetical protein [Melioribacteraceae bacterium]
MPIVSFPNDEGIVITRFESSEGRMINLDDAYFFNARLFSNPKNSHDVNFHEACEKLFTKLGISGKKLDNKFDALKNIICNLSNCHIHNKVVSYNRGKNYYSSMMRIGFNHLSYDNVVGIVDKLVSYGYVEGVTGNYDRNTGKGRVSRMWATKKLIDELNESYSQVCHDLDDVKILTLDGKPFNIVETKFKPIDLESVMFINDGATRRYIPAQSKYVKSSTEQLIMYNEFMDKQSVLINKLSQDYNLSNDITLFSGLTNTTNVATTSTYNNLTINYVASSTEVQVTTQDPITSTKSEIPLIYKPETTFSYRVYNDSRLSFGGRFYGPTYQGQSQNARSQIIINGFPTVEIDYSAYHLGMLYNLENLNISDKTYDLFGSNPQLRKSVKLMFNMLLNAESKNSAVVAFNWGLNKPYENSEKRQKMLAIKEEMRKNNLSWQNIIDKIVECHPKINKYLFTGYGRNLQKIDSDIAANILKKMTEKDIPSLVIHDSFIVPEQNASELEDAMREAYLNRFNFDCRLERK